VPWLPDVTEEISPAYAERVSDLPFPQPPLADDVVMLRPWREEDAPMMAAWGQDPVIVRWTGVPAGYTAAAARSWIARTENERRQGRTLSLAIVDATSSAVLGSCDIRRPDPGDPALGEVGYLLSRTARGRGVATRAIGLLVAWSIGELGMGRVEALVHPDNPPSLAVLGRLGFECTGALRPSHAGGGAREDRLVYSMPRGGPSVSGTAA